MPTLPGAPPVHPTTVADAKLVTDGKRSVLGGTFFEPTVLTDMTTDMVITENETSARSRRSTASRPTPG
jgi:succinate-semialdehyde dehydrogenase/glutarate-semialdehyde dehydrogenase